jgi:hypothetical protein
VRKSCVQVAVVLLMLACLACTGCVSWMPHGRTGATKKVKKRKSGFVPKPSHTYHVIGENEDFVGCIIRYDKTLYRGGNVKFDSAAKYLRAWGIKAIVSATPSDREREFAEDRGFNLVGVPFEKGKALSAETLGLLHRTLKGDGGAYYVHGHEGRQRGGAIGVFYRMHVQGWSFEDAVVEFKKLGGDYGDNEALLQSIGNYRP